MDKMRMSAKGIDWLKQVESLALKPYDDQTGKPITAWVAGATIGYGHLISTDEWPRYKNGIDRAEAEELMGTDMVPFVRAVNQNVTAPLAQHQFDALTIFAYNIGTGAFANSSVVKLVNNPGATTSYRSLEDAWKAWNKSQGKVLKGLANRRNAEWIMYDQGRYEHW